MINYGSRAPIGPCVELQTNPNPYLHSAGGQPVPCSRMHTFCPQRWRTAIVAKDASLKPRPVHVHKLYATMRVHEYTHGKGCVCTSTKK